MTNSDIISIIEPTPIRNRLELITIVKRIGQHIGLAVVPDERATGLISRSNGSKSSVLHFRVWFNMAWVNGVTCGAVVSVRSQNMTKAYTDFTRASLAGGAEQPKLTYVMTWRFVYEARMLRELPGGYWDVFSIRSTPLTILFDVNGGYYGLRAQVIGAMSIDGGLAVTFKLLG